MEYKTQEEFDAFFKEKYQPVGYEDVREAYADYVQEADKHIFISDYEEQGLVDRATFLENLHEEAAFQFQDILTEAFYDKNPEVYETAFAIFEEEQMTGAKTNVAKSFHEEYNRIYRECMERMFDEYFA